jgi:hypothetical protein
LRFELPFLRDLLHLRFLRALGHILPSLLQSLHQTFFLKPVKDIAEDPDDDKENLIQIHYPDSEMLLSEPETISLTGLSSLSSETCFIFVSSARLAIFFLLCCRASDDDKENLIQIHYPDSELLLSEPETIQQDQHELPSANSVAQEWSQQWSQRVRGQVQEWNHERVRRRVQV